MWGSLRLAPIMSCNKVKISKYTIYTWCTYVVHIHKGVRSNCRALNLAHTNKFGVLLEVVNLLQVVVAAVGGCRAATVKEVEPLLVVAGLPQLVKVLA